MPNPLNTYQRDLDNLPTADHERSELCLFELLKILFGPASPRYRIQASSLILRYVAPFPVRGRSLTPDDTVSWLESLAPPETKGY